MKLSPGFSPTTAATTHGANVTAPGSFGPLAKTLAFMPSLLVAGSLGAQAAGAPAASADPAPASTDTAELPAVTVESSSASRLASPKFTAPLIDTPQTVVVIPREVFEQQGAANLSDVLRNTPGITFTAGEGGGGVASGDTFTMRGFDTSGSIFVDGVRSSGAVSRDIYNIEQVEIAKGPAGADTGRGGASGYVNLVTKTPQLTDFTRGSVSYGVSEHAGEDQRRSTLDINRNLGDLLPGAAFRLNLLGQDSGTPGRDEIKNRSWGVSPSLALGLGSPTRLIVAANYDHQDNIPDSGVPAAAARDGLYLDPAGSSTTLTPVASPVSGDIFGNYYGLDGDYELVTQRSVLARVEHDFNPDLRLTNQSKLGDTRRDALTSYVLNGSSYDASTNTVTPRRTRVQTDNTILSNQTNLSAKFATGFVEHSFSTGLELTRERQFSPTYTAVDGPATDADHPDSSRTATASQTPYRAANNPYTEARIDTAALYAFDTLQLTEKLLLNASARLERYRSEFEYLAAATTSAPSPSVIRYSADGTLFTWKTGLVFKPRPEGSLYVAYGNSFTPPGSNFTFSTTPGNANDPGLDPQETVSYEAGIKWELCDRRLSASLAVYRTINSNVATNIGTTAAPVIVYDTEQTARGVELGLSGKITPEWLVFGGIGFIDTEISSPNTSATDGSSLRYTPRLSGNLFTTYALTKRLTLGGGAQYTETVTRSNNSTVTGSSTNTTDSYVLLGVPDYWLFNALAAYAVNDHLTLRLNVNNVFDERYYRINYNGGRIYPGATRTWVLSADFSF